MKDLLLFHRNLLVAKFVAGELIPTNFDMLPLYLQRTANFEKWLEMRAIDNSRAHARLLKKVFRLNQYDDIETVLASNAATITDNYWVKDIDDTTTTFSDVIFNKRP
ncbi:MAG: hypothetical protein LBE09_00050 [Christensenellaceae bacterium]|jgi:hypothetical protein|nr:hypothetical protein [Christensenellaceae bacterium]